MSLLNFTSEIDCHQCCSGSGVSGPRTHWRYIRACRCMAVWDVNPDISNLSVQPFSCLWDKQLKGCTERFEMSGLASQTIIHLQARMYRQRVRGPETPEPLQHWWQSISEVKLSSDIITVRVDDTNNCKSGYYNREESPHRWIDNTQEERYALDLRWK